MTIRKATPEDSPSVWDLILQLAEFERLAHQVDGSEALLRQQMEQGNCQVLVVELDGAIVAFALYFLNFSTFRARPGLYLEDLFVVPEHRGKGIGTALLTHLRELARAEEYGRFEWSVLDWNESAIKVYERFGATLMTDWRICRVTL